MQLALRQDREADPVIFAVTHFTEYAADWRDVMFLPQYSVSHLIPWSEFEQAFLNRFVPIQKLWLNEHEASRPAIYPP